LRELWEVYTKEETLIGFSITGTVSLTGKPQRARKRLPIKIMVKHRTISISNNIPHQSANKKGLRRLTASKPFLNGARDEN
jgi:hypothetical protein